MADTKSIVYMFAVLVPLALVYSQNAPTLPGLPPFPGPPHIPGLPTGIPGLPGSSGSSSEHPVGDHDHQDRLFFTLFPSLTSCNYTAEPGLTCRSCTQSLNCLSSNVGIIRTCPRRLRYCNDGICSNTEGSACTSTSTTTTTTTTTTAATAGKK